MPRFAATHRIECVTRNELTTELCEVSRGLAERFNSAAATRDIVSDLPDYHFLALDGDEAIARCSIWAPANKHPETGLIGHFASVSSQAAEAILEAACKKLKERGAKTAIGPIDSSTWKRYRFVTESSDEPPFFLEPQNPTGWQNHFSGAGFAPIRTYGSSVNEDLTVIDSEGQAIRESLLRCGVRLRRLNAPSVESDLRGIHRVTEIAMSKNFLFNSMSEEQFVAMHKLLLPYVAHEAVIIAERREEVVGFLFSVPNHLEGAKPKTLVMKTIARLPDKELKGLGRLLYAEAHRAAHELGFTRAIHALFALNNRAHVISDYYARPIRQYQLFGREL
ncbi:MAG TPA: GNAT family N-acetyltransferase [Candidatus Obscuribacterales bacterium]